MKKALLVLMVFAASAQAQKWQVIGWNDLGMHCMDGTDFSVFSILPPYNTIHAHVLLDGEPVGDDVVAVTFEAVADPAGSINTTAADKCNFWEHVADMFGAQPSNDVGLAGVAMPGTANTPQPMVYEPAHQWFTGEGIPITPFDDAGKVNYYPMMKIVVRDTFGTERASTKIVLPVSDEMTCSACHQSGSAPDARPLLGWRWHPDHDKDIKLNILRLHDEKQVGNPAYAQALLEEGFNTNGLYPTVVADQTAILCARCHHSNALPVPANTNVVATMTQAMHAHHGQVNDPASGLVLDSSLNRDSCYRCHPGSSTQCLRGAMGAAVAADGGLAIECQSCHGQMSDVGAVSRNGWFDEPSCQSCHTGTATDNNGEIRYLSVFEPGGAERVAVNSTFAHPANTLYRFSTGHGGLQCSACHGSPHAIYPSAHTNDNIQNIDMQGHKGTVIECKNCHVYDPLTFNGGPHGMHPVGDTAFARKADGRPEEWFHGQVKEDGNIGVASCKACHGTDFSGTVLSLAQGERQFVFGDGIGPIHFWKGYRVGCYTCHNGPNSEAPNPNSPPVVVSTSAATTANMPVAIPLTTDKGELRIVSQAQNGTVGLSGSTATYYPFLNVTGTDSFTFAAWDGVGRRDSNLATVTVSVAEGACILVCESLVPSNAVARTALPFWAFATVSNGTDAVSYAWDFGDGGGSTAALAQHAYGKNGTYPWSVIASAGGFMVTNSGAITVGNVQLDTDGDGIEDDWEWETFQSLETAGEDSDFDDDGQSDKAEYLCGSDATDAGSNLAFNEVAPSIVRWASEPNRIYTINATTSLVATAFTPLATGIASTPPENTYTDLTASDESVKFYQVELE
ncbi:hypothetical protein PDESU_05882 [Pontiella desulfatans]|uniref:PKD domain-containing protein n=1 Tax=Pontiella desulfatans TaxID=2750659 RepID=A0A6C2UDJ6_PONDE|nr:PKD domain-containing protein [Pontiella desulfatans]VGO17286.1 hypothetical protein PDESU_05882 [Pontiella desulfatans]